MKKGIHPEQKDCKVTCSCGATFMTKSTKDEIYIEVCNECHPFYTGKQGKSKKAGKRSALTSLKAEVIFDFSREESSPVVTLIPTDGNQDLQQIIERFADDSVGPGIGHLYFCQEDQL